MPVSVISFSWEIYGALPSYVFAPSPVQVRFASPLGAILGRVLRFYPVFASPVVITLSTEGRFSPGSKMGPLASFVGTVSYYFVLVSGSTTSLRGWLFYDRWKLDCFSSLSSYYYDFFRPYLFFFIRLKERLFMCLLIMVVRPISLVNDWWLFSSSLLTSETRHGYFRLRMFARRTFANTTCRYRIFHASSVAATFMRSQFV